MRLFLDTNVFVEFVGRRKQFAPVSRIIDAIAYAEHSAYISAGSIYTLTYLFEQGLKEQEVHKPELTKRLRTLLADVLNLVTIVQLPHVCAEAAIYDVAFTDIEDSFQYHCAFENRCDVLITINIKDYENADQSDLEILTPAAFVDKYLK
ncbi:MAG: type II toxin-antitoxin system VapC family toxin [Prevotella sp.]|nr:type II toxin-antitoxin system VapC family toxin [Prevotella sp.]